VIKDVMVVAAVPVVHNSGSQGEVQYLGLTPPNHGQMLGANAQIIDLPSGRTRSGPPARTAHTAFHNQVRCLAQLRTRNHLAG
jgi:hypothetical protein